MRTRPIAVVLLVGVSLLLSGCSSPSHGWVGLLRDENNGSLRPVAEMCKGAIDGATLYDVDDSERPSFMFDSRAPAGVLRKKLTVDDLDPRVTYHLYGWTHSGELSASGPDITRQQVAGLRPGDVLAKDLDDSRRTVRRFTREDFVAMVRADCEEQQSTHR